MGQPVAVVEKPSSTRGVVRFESNRNLGGQGHDRYTSAVEATGSTPSAELARRLFATGSVSAVHVFSNIITVDLAKGSDSSGLADIVRDLYQYWKPGMQPPAFEDLVAPDEAAPATAGAAGDGATTSALSEAAKRVPAHLLERSRLAREKWVSKPAE
jgi:hypothetical protein